MPVHSLLIELEMVTSQTFYSLPEPCFLAGSFLLHRQIPPAGDPLYVHLDGSDHPEGGIPHSGTPQPPWVE